jgi:hypothetical protein
MLPLGQGIGQEGGGIDGGGRKQGWRNTWLPWPQNGAKIAGYLEIPWKYKFKKKLKFENDVQRFELESAR